MGVGEEEGVDPGFKHSSSIHAFLPILLGKTVFRHRRAHHFRTIGPRK